MKPAVERRPAWQLVLLMFGMMLTWAYYHWDIVHEPLNLVILSPRLLVCGILAVIILQRWRGAERTLGVLLVDIPQEKPQPLQAHVWWPIIGLAALVGSFVFLELRDPYYFTQDDNLSQFMPTIFQACRGWKAGIFPTWNPYQFLGSPTSSVGTYALTYPPTWLSYWFATYIFRNENATIEIFAIGHLLAAYGIMYWAVRREGCRPSLATLASLCCVLSGYALIVGRSWFYVIPALAWVPLMIVSSQALRTGRPGIKWIVFSGLAIGAFAHAGNVQLWIYSLLLFAFAAAVLLWTGIIPLHWLPRLLAGALVGCGVASPLLVAQYLATRQVMRAAFDNGIVGGLPSLLVPVTIVQTWHPAGWGTAYKQYVGQMYYSGTIFCLVGTALLVALIMLRWNRSVVARNIWFLCALVAFLFALGDIGVLWPLLQHVPGFNKFRLPFKFLEFFNIYIAVAGAIVCERLMRRFRLGFSGELAIVTLVGALLAYHCTLARASFCTFGFGPYPAADPALTERLLSHDNRSYPKVLPVGPVRSTNSDYMDSLQLQWPSLFRFFSVDGYDPLVSESSEYAAVHQRLGKQPAAWLQEYGVQYVVTYDVSWPVWLRVPAKEVYRSGRVTLWSLPIAKPMAWADLDPSRPLAVKFDVGGADIDTSELTNAGWITVNMLRRPEISAFVDNQRVDVGVDSWSRIRIFVSPGQKFVRVRFSPAWKAGFALAAVFLVLAFLCYWYGAWQDRRMNKTVNSRDRQGLEEADAVPS